MIEIQLYQLLSRNDFTMLVTLALTEVSVLTPIRTITVNKKQKLKKWLLKKDPGRNFIFLHENHGESTPD